MNATGSLPRNRRRSLAAAIETLEARIAPATLTFGAALTTYGATAGEANVFTIAVSGSNYTFTDTAETITLVNAPGGASGSGTNTVTIPLSAFNAGALILVALDDGNDTLNINGLRHSLTLSNDTGADTVNINTGATAVNGSLNLAAETQTITSLNGANAITLSVDALAVNGAVGFGGTLTLQQLTSGRPINLGTETAGALSITAAEFGNLIHSGTTKIGNTSSGAITISDALLGIAGTLSLKTGAGITDTAAGSIQLGALAIDADATVTLDGNHDVAQLAALLSDTGAGFTFADDSGFEIGTVDGISGITTDVGAGENVTFTTFSATQGATITQAVGANIVADGLRLLGPGPFTLNDPTNDVNVLAASTGSSGLVRFTDADDLSIGTVAGTQGVTTTNGAINITTLAGDLRVLNADAAATPDIDAGTSFVELTAGSAGADHAIIIDASAGVSGQPSGGAATLGIQLRADRMSIGATLNAGGASVNLVSFETDTAIALGSADAAGTLGLTNAELNFITAGRLTIGTTNAPVTVNSAISLTLMGEVGLSGASLSGTGSIATNALLISSAGAVALNGANDVNLLALVAVGGPSGPISFADSDGFTFGRVQGSQPFNPAGTGTLLTLNAGSATITFDSSALLQFNLDGTTPGVDHDQVAVTGAVTITGGSITVQTNAVLPSGAEVVILSNDGADAIAGTFTNQPEGTLFNFASGQAARLSYIGGDGNDVSLTLLESDLAISPDGKTATFSDVDGDLVTVKTTRGAFEEADFAFGFVADNRQQLQRLALDADFTGAGITITAKRTANGGNGFVNVGFINATGVDLGAVKIAGDLGQIDAGTVGGDAKVPGVKSLAVQSIGLLGTSTQGAGGSLTSAIQGALPKLTVKGDVRDVNFSIVGATDGRLGSATIGGSLVDTSTSNGLFITVEAGIGSLKIGGDIRTTIAGGGVGSQIKTKRAIGSLTVGGSIVVDGPLAPTIPLQIFAFGNATSPAAGRDLAIGKIDVKGTVQGLRITAGDDGSGNRNDDASIGSITVGGDWLASSATAGVNSNGAAGNDDDAKFGAGARDEAGLFATIGSFTVKGQALGTVAVQTDMFGIVAERIGKAAVGKRSFTFTVDPAISERRAYFAAPTGPGAGAENPAFDFTIRELGSTTPTPAFGGSQLTISTDGKTATYVDVDGDLVTAKRTLGTFVAGDFQITDNAVGGGQLTFLSLNSAPGGAPFDVAITARPGPDGGNGFANVGNIFGQTVSGLRALSIAGDVEQFTIGNGTDAAAKTLTFHSMGQLAGGTGDLANVNGALGKLVVKTDVRGMHLLNQQAGIGEIAIGGSFIGGSGSDAGHIDIASRIGALKIGGSIRAGTGADSAIIEAFSLGTISIGGDIVGSAAVPVEIEARGLSPTPATGPDTALKSLAVKGGVERLLMTIGNNINADAAVGTISVGRGWIASSVLVGVKAGTDTFVGTEDDAKLTGTDVATRFSSIASILIKGQALGTTTANDTFGIVAEQIGKAQIGAVKFALAKGARSAADAFAIAPTGPGGTGLSSDFFLREIVV